MSRWHRCAALALLALVVIGFGASASKALAGDPCCPGMPIPGPGDATPPCHSIAPSSCCGEMLVGPTSNPPAAPLWAAFVASDRDAECALHRADEPRASRSAQTAPAARILRL